ncbi:MAG: LPXTG cell wall anchor domain-containing protein, partial [Acidimicrobiales bacterium]
CDMVNLTPITTDGDGNASTTVNTDVPAEGITILAGSADQDPANISFKTVVVDPNALALTGPSSTSTIILIGFTMFALGGAALVLSRRSSLVTA